jgi:membrane protein DedA with SNARE-associated domain
VVHAAGRPDCYVQPRNGQDGVVTDWITSVIDALGPFGVGVLITLETIIPPIPSELVLPLAGFRAREGAMNVVLVWFAATVGGVAGALLLYWLGACMGYDRLHRIAGRSWFVIASQRDVDRGCALFERHGSWVVAASRCVPVLRSLVSLPAGMTGMPLPKFLALTALGTGVWNAAFIAAGWFLADRWQKVDAYTGPASLVVVGLIVVGLAVLAWRRRHEKATVRS